VIRVSKYEASDVFPGPGSNIRHPLSVFPSLHRVLRDQFPGFIGSMKVLRLPVAHLAALRFLRLAIPRMHSLCSLLGGRVRRQGLELLTRYLRPGCCRGSNRISQVPGEPQLSVCTCSNPTPAGLLAPDHYGAAAWPLVEQRQRLPRKVFRSSIAWLSDSLSTLRRTGYPATTQDSLPAAGQALPDGLSTRKVPTKGFRSASLHLVPLSQALLGTIFSTDAPNPSSKLNQDEQTDARSGVVRRVPLQGEGGDLRSHLNDLRS